MKIKEMYYERVKNLGNYETERLGATVVLTEKDNINDSFRQIKDFVEKKLGVWE